MTVPADRCQPWRKPRRRLLKAAAGERGCAGLARRPRLVRAQAGAEDAHRLLADRGRPAVLRRGGEGLLQGGRAGRRSDPVRRRAADHGSHAVRAAATAAPTAPARPTSPSARSPRPAPSRSSPPTRATSKNVLDSSSCRSPARSRRWPISRASGSASGPGIQNVTLAKTVLERAGATGATVVELPIGQHVAALAAGQVDACLHAGADRHDRPHERHARACSRPA